MRIPPPEEESAGYLQRLRIDNGPWFYRELEWGPPSLIECRAIRRNPQPAIAVVTRNRGGDSERGRVDDVHAAGARVGPRTIR